MTSRSTRHLCTLAAVFGAMGLFSCSQAFISPTSTSSNQYVADISTLPSTPQYLLPVKSSLSRRRNVSNNIQSSTHNRFANKRGITLALAKESDDDFDPQTNTITKPNDEASNPDSQPQSTKLEEQTQQKQNPDPPKKERKEQKEQKEPSPTAKATLGLYKLYSYCIIFLGTFFSFGLLLNILGFGYTFDLERGLHIDRMENIRNEVQFEREIEREMREELRGYGGSKYIVAPKVPE